MNIKINIAEEKHLKYIDTICKLIYEASQHRGTGIAVRKSTYIWQKIKQGKAIIATDGNSIVGFCYIESWGHDKYVANSGLIVSEEYRGNGIAKKIKKAAFKLSRKKFPEAKLFGLTTSLAVMKINSSLGYKPVTFSEFTKDDTFWNDCQNCVNHDILMRTNRKHCLCTGMLYDPKSMSKIVPFKTKLKSYRRLLRYKRSILLKNNKPKEKKAKSKMPVFLHFIFKKTTHEKQNCTRL